MELDLEQQPIHPPEEASSEPHTFPLMPPHPSRPPSTPSPAPPLAIQVPQPPLPNSTNPETKTKDVILGGFKLFLKSASGVADVIPDPVGKIVKVIAETGVRVMEVLDVRIRESTLHTRRSLTRNCRISTTTRMRPGDSAGIFAASCRLLFSISPTSKACQRLGYVMASSRCYLRGS